MKIDRKAKRHFAILAGNPTYSYVCTYSYVLLDHAKLAIILTDGNSNKYIAILKDILCVKMSSQLNIATD